MEGFDESRQTWHIHQPEPQYYLTILSPDRRLVCEYSRLKGSNKADWVKPEDQHERVIFNNFFVARQALIQLASAPSGCVKNLPAGNYLYGLHAVWQQELMVTVPFTN
jgi:hypothetical protein